jgi:hypothetical protein
MVSLMRRANDGEAWRRWCVVVSGAWLRRWWWWWHCSAKIQDIYDFSKADISILSRVTKQSRRIQIAAIIRPRCRFCLYYSSASRSFLWVVMNGRKRFWFGFAKFGVAQG